MKRLLFAAVIAAAVASVACLDSLTPPTSPATSATTEMGYLTAGDYASVAPLPDTSGSCTSFSWQVTDATRTSAAGNFSALCRSDLRVTGTARGTLADNTITWAASGNGVSPTMTTCAVSLTGTIVVGSTQIRVVYTGTTCLGPVSGAEILRR
jgi:hypothetical protein